MLFKNNIFTNLKTNLNPSFVYTSKDGNRSIEKTDTDVIDKESVVNWDKNRPPDDVRISQIAEHYKITNADIVPGIIYVWKNNSAGDGKYIVYDGIHRLLAAFSYGKKMTVLLHITKTDQEKDIIDDFTNINKSVCVPVLYLEENNVLKRNVCESVAKKMCDKYQHFVSPSRRPFIYNFNRDNLIDFVSTFMIDFTKQSVDIIIFNEFIGLNNVARQYVNRNKIDFPKKCKYHEFYLWYLDKTLIKNQIENTVRNL